MIVTNNVKVKEKYEAFHQVLFVQGGYKDVLVSARDLIHKGYVLKTHPLMGSLKPNETPYRSLILSDSSLGNADVNSVMIIEDGLMAFDRFAKDARPDRGEHATEKIKEDFRVIDLSLIMSALEKNENERGGYL